MVFKVRMPRVDANVEEGTIGRWLAGVGERLEKGAPLVEIITDKASFEFEAEYTGFLRVQVAPGKSVVPVGFVVALMSADAAEALPDVAEENRAILANYRAALIGGGGPPGPPAPAGADLAHAKGGPRATPAARRMAAEHGIGLAELAERVGGVVQRAHVEEEIRHRDRGAKGD